MLTAPRWLLPMVLLMVVIIGALLLPRPLLLLTGQIVGMLAVMLGVLCYAGFGVTWLLRSPRLLPMLPLFTPVIGMGALLAVGYLPGYLPIGTNVLLWPLLLFFTVVNIWAWQQGARPRMKQRHWLALIPAAVALVLGVLPLYQVGYLTTVGGSIDAIFYLVRSEYRQISGVMTTAPAAPLVPPFLDHIRGQMNLREGDTFLLALYSSIFGMRPHYVFSVMMAGWFALTAVGVFVLVRSELRLNQWVALGAGLLVSVQSVIHTSVANNGFSQNAGLAIWPFVITAVLAAVRAGTRRGIILAGLLIATLVALYPPYLVYLVPVVSIITLGELYARWRQRIRRVPAPITATHQLQALQEPLLVLMRRGFGMIAAALLTIPFTWVHFMHHMNLVDRITGRDVMKARGDISDFPHPGELIGIINHVEAVYHFWDLPQLPLHLATVLLTIAGIIMVYGLFRMRARQRTFFTALILVLSAGMFHLRFWLRQGQGDAYLYFKVASLAVPFLVVLLIVGCFLLLHDIRTLQPRLRRTLQGALVLWLVGIFGIATAHTWNTAASFGEGRGVIATQNQLTIDEINRLLPPDEPLLILDKTTPGAMWTGYILDRPNVYYRQQSPDYWTPTQVYSPDLIKYALVAYPQHYWEWDELPGEPWFLDRRMDEVWSNGDYRLLRRTDATVAEFPMLLDWMHFELTQKVTITITEENITVHGMMHNGRETPDGTFEQRFARRPEQLKLLTAAEQPGHLLVTYADGRQEALPLIPNELQTFNFDVNGPMTMELVKETAGMMWLSDVRVLGEPTPATAEHTR
ncbi:MAG: hypothetical protein HC876_04910 [Chloroflexaceae bacterium]|nr:hypothetical protein [Chloroflexaceae bacterium]